MKRRIIFLILPLLLLVGCGAASTSTGTAASTRSVVTTGTTTTANGGIAVGATSGTSAATTTASSAKKTTALQIVRVSLTSKNNYPTFVPRTITNPSTVQRLYDAARALPVRVLSSKTYCPATTSGLEYHLSFSQANNTTQEIVLQLEGCASVQFAKSDVRSLSKSFLQLFERTTGLTEAQLEPLPA